MPTNIVNIALTMVSGAIVRRLPLVRAMRASNSKAGGCFLAICIIAGFIVGLAIGNPMKGVILGTVGGVVIAMMLWLADRRAR